MTSGLPQVPTFKPRTRIPDDRMQRNVYVKISGCDPETFEEGTYCPDYVALKFERRSIRDDSHVDWSIHAVVTGPRVGPDGSREASTWLRRRFDLFVDTPGGPASPELADWPEWLTTLIGIYHPDNYRSLS